MGFESGLDLLSKNERLFFLVFKRRRIWRARKHVCKLDLEIAGVGKAKSGFS